MSNSKAPEYLSALKIQKIRGSDIPKGRKGKSRVKAQKAAIKLQIEKDKELLRELVFVRDIRAGFARGHGKTLDAVSVYAENDFDYSIHQIDVRDFATWRELSDLMKAYLGFLLAIEYSGFSFTVNVNPELEASWKLNDVDALDRVKRMLNKQLSAYHLNGIPLFLALEGKSKTGRNATHLHMHGYFLPENPFDETRMQKVFEKAFYPKLIVKKGRSKPVEIVRSYEHPDKDKGAVHWVNYGVKNVLTPGSKIKTSQLYLSNSLRGAVKEFWSIIRQDF